MAQMSGMDKYKFRRALEQIEEAAGRGTELVSVYIPPERPIFDVTNYLRGEQSQSSNIKSASTRKHVTQAIESAMQRLKAYKMPPPNGLVIFTGHKQVGADQTQMVTFVLEPPEPVTSFLYRCDSKFYTEPLHEMLAEKDVYGLLVIDWSEATLGLLRGKRIEVIKNLQSQVPSKHRMGGQSARRFERGHDIAVHEWYKKIGDLMTEAFLNQPDLKGIIIGGPGYSKEEFATGGYLHHELKKKVLPTFLDTGYTDEYGLRELVEKSREILSGLDLMREKSLVQRLMEEIRKEDGGLAAYGEDQVRHALQLGAVETLLISEGLRKSRLKLRCANGDWEGEKTVSEDGELPTCPKDGGALTVVENRDLIEDLSATAEGIGTSVNFSVELGAFAEHVLVSARSASESYGASPPRKERVLLEHTSANPTGPLNVGRARNPFVGDALVRLMRIAGYPVTSEYLVNDIGRQMVLLYWAVTHLPAGSSDSNEPIEYRYVKLYQKASAQLEADEALKQEVERLTQRFERGDVQLTKDIRKVGETVLRSVLETLRRVNVGFDSFFWESDAILDGSVQRVIERLMPVSKEEDGARYLDLSEFGLAGDAAKYLFVSRDGTSLYTTRDIAYHLNKMGRCDIAIDLIGEDHKLSFLRLKAALKLMGVEWEPETIFYAFVNLPEGRMSTRKGRGVYLDDLIDEAIERAYAEVAKRREELPEGKKGGIAETIGIAV